MDQMICKYYIIIFKSYIYLLTLIFQSHDIMNLCWKIDSKQRPSFKEVVPKFEALLTDSHSKVKTLKLF